MIYLRLVFVVIVAAALAGCNGGGGSQTLRFWQFWDVAIIEPIIEEFERQNPDIDVEVEQLTWASGLEKIQAAIASGTQPDLCELGSTWVPRFSYEGVLADITPLFNEINDEYMMWDSAIWQNRCYGAPWVQGSRALFYNAELFRRAGLDPEQPPETWADLLDAAERINELSPDTYGFGLNLGERYVLYKKFMAFAWGNGGRIIDDDGTVAYNSAANHEALEFYRVLAEFSLKEKQEVLDHNFRSGRLGMQISGAWNIRNFAKEAPDLDYRVALVPRPPNGGTHASFAGAEMLVVFAKSQRQEDAIKLARFLMSYEPAKQLSQSVKSVFPASKMALEDPDFLDDPRTRVFVEQALTSRTPPAHPGWIDIEDIINRSVEEVMYGKAEPQQSLDDAADEIEGVVARFDKH